jgi:hypothetical protein
MSDGNGEGAEQWQRSMVAVRYRVDLSAVLIALLWGVLLLMLWPHGVLGRSGRSGGYKSIVVAHDATFPADKIYLRPDLIALSSPVSFVPRVDSDPTVVALLEKNAGAPMLLTVSNQFVAAESSHDVALAAEAVRNMAGDESCLPPLKISSKLGKVAGHGSSVLVSVAGSFGDGVKLSWSSADRVRLFNVGRPWEVELTVDTDDAGNPENVFLEKRSGIEEIDREVVRAVSRADLWSGAGEGTGRILISYSPEKKME